MEHSTPLFEAQLAHKSLEQCRNIYGRKIGECVRYRIRQNYPIAMAQCAAGVDDVWYIAFTLCRLWPHEWLARPGENPGWIVLVEKNSPNGIFPHWPDAMRQQQPAFIQFDG